MSTINSLVVNVTPFISKVSFYDVREDGEVNESNKKISFIYTGILSY